MTASSGRVAFAARGTTAEIEAGQAFQPKFDADGLIPAIVTDASDGRVLMFAWMDRDALAATLETRLAHFYSRSRQRQWMKGEESGNVLRVHEIRTDCDQDVILVLATVEGQGVACHTGARSCFYRTLDLTSKPLDACTLAPVEAIQPSPVHPGKG